MSEVNNNRPYDLNEENRKKSIWGTFFKWAAAIIGIGGTGAGVGVVLTRQQYIDSEKNALQNIQAKDLEIQKINNELELSKKDQEQKEKEANIAIEQLEKVKAANDDLASENIALQKANTDLQSKEILLKAENESLTNKTKDLADASEQLAEAQAELAEKKADIVLKDATIKSQEADLAEKDAKIGEVTTNLASAQADIAVKDATIKQQENALAEKDAKIGEVTTNLTAAQTDIATKDATIKQQENALAEKDAKIGEVTTNLTAAQADIATKDATIKQQEADLAEKDAKIGEVTTNLTAAQADIATKDATIKSQEADLAEKDAKLNEKSDDLTRVINDYTEATIKNVQLETKLDEATANLTAAQADIATKDATIKSQEADLAEKDAKLNEATTNLTAAQTEIATKDATIKQQENDLAEKDAKLNEVTTNLTAAQTEIATKDATIKQQEDALSAQTAKINEMEAANTKTEANEATTDNNEETLENVSEETYVPTLNNETVTEEEFYNILNNYYKDKDRPLEKNTQAFLHLDDTINFLKKYNNAEGLKRHIGFMSFNYEFRNKADSNNFRVKADGERCLTLDPFSTACFSACANEMNQFQLVKTMGNGIKSSGNIERGALNFLEIMHTYFTNATEPLDFGHIVDDEFALETINKIQDALIKVNTARKNNKLSSKETDEFIRVTADFLIKESKNMSLFNQMLCASLIDTYAMVQAKVDSGEPLYLHVKIGDYEAGFNLHFVNPDEAKTDSEEVNNPDATYEVINLYNLLTNDYKNGTNEVCHDFFMTLNSVVNDAIEILEKEDVSSYVLNINDGANLAKVALMIDTRSENDITSLIRVRLEEASKKKYSFKGKRWTVKVTYSNPGNNNGKTEQKEETEVTTKEITEEQVTTDEQPDVDKQKEDIQKELDTQNQDAVDKQTDGLDALVDDVDQNGENYEEVKEKGEKDGVEVTEEWYKVQVEIKQGEIRKTEEEAQTEEYNNSQAQQSEENDAETKTQQKKEKDKLDEYYDDDEENGYSNEMNPEFGEERYEKTSKKNDSGKKITSIETNSSKFTAILNAKHNFGLTRKFGGSYLLNNVEKQQEEKGKTLIYSRNTTFNDNTQRISA